MYFIGWFPFGASLVGLISMYLIEGSLIRRLILTLLSSSIGLAAALAVITYGGYLEEIGLSSSIFLTEYGLYVLSMQIILVLIGCLITLIIERIFK